MGNWNASTLSNSLHPACGDWVLTILEYKWEAHDVTTCTPILWALWVLQPGGAPCPNQWPLKWQNPITYPCDSLTSHCNHFQCRRGIYWRGFPQPSHYVGCWPVCNTNSLPHQQPHQFRTIQTISAIRFVRPESAACGNVQPCLSLVLSLASICHYLIQGPKILWHY